jgi:hypothetical protein
MTPNPLISLLELLDKLNEARTPGEWEARFATGEVITIFAHDIRLLPIPQSFDDFAFIASVANSYAALSQSLRIAVGALERIKSVVGTSSESWHFADKAIAEVAELVETIGTKTT